MAELTRGERMVQILVFLLANHGRRYTISDIMGTLDIPRQDLRSVQRDLSALRDIPGDYIQQSQEGRSVFYSAVFPEAEGLLFPKSDDVLLQFVFLRRISNMYPATSSLIAGLVDKIQESLPVQMRDDVESQGKLLNDRILFMGPPPGLDEDIDKKLMVALKAIGKSQKIVVKYTDNFNRTTEKLRTPLMIVIDSGEPYLACVSESRPGKTYVLKFRRMESVQLAKEFFTPKPADLENIRERVRSGGMLSGEQSPKCEDIVIYFPSYAKNFLTERPYNRTMRIRKSDDYTIRVTMKAEVNETLKQWVLGHGADAEVEKPAILKQMVIDSAKAILNLYKKQAAARKAKCHNSVKVLR